jgi:hypothetical protein
MDGKFLPSISAQSNDRLCLELSNLCDVGES